MPRQKPAPKSRPSRRRAPTATNQPPAPSDFASRPDATRDEFIALMGELREHNQPAYAGLLAVLRLDAPMRSAVLRLIEAVMPQLQPQPPLVKEALDLFAAITSPSAGWATDAEAIDSTLYHLALAQISFGDRGRAGLVLASALAHATDEERLAVVRALREDHDRMLASERAAGGAS